MGTVSYQPHSAVNTMKVFLMSVLVAATMAEPELKESGLKVELISKPDTCDKVARNGDMLSMHYVGTLESGAKFDSSYDRSEPFKFQIGVGQVIKGWEEGVLGMCIGEKRRLVVPPELGYGAQGAGDIIPGGATLFFDVELVGAEEGRDLQLPQAAGGDHGQRWGRAGRGGQEDDGGPGQAGGGDLRSRGQRQGRPYLTRGVLRTK